MEYLQDIKNPNICLSGGADGADIEWGNCADSIGHEVIHWSFPSHPSAAPEGQLIRLTDEQLAQSDEALKSAADTLDKSLPKRPKVSRLLRRNYFQVAWSEACYAVTYFEGGKQAPGGTVWATTMFTQLHPGNHNLYIFDQLRGVWLQWIGDSWMEIESPPRPCGIWTGIGARALQPNGRDAIRKVMGVDYDHQGITACKGRNEVFHCVDI